MKFAYCSDPHLDFYFNPEGGLSTRKIGIIFDSYFKDLDSEYLIVAGDIGHYPLQNALILNYMKEAYGFKEIITVQGNHDGYRVSKSQKAKYPTGLHKIAYQIDLFRENDIIALDGDIIDINGIKVGGVNSFYDGSIYYRQTTGWYNSSGGIDAYWKRTMNDSSHMGLSDFHDYSKQEKDKLLKLKDNCDIIITHVKPVIEQRFFAEKYKGELSNAFYSFDWVDNLVEDTKLKHWVYGHTHNKETWDVFGKTLSCNPFGYPNENKNNKIEHIVV